MVLCLFVDYNARSGRDKDVSLFRGKMKNENSVTLRYKAVRPQLINYGVTKDYCLILLSLFPKNQTLSVSEILPIDFKMNNFFLNVPVIAQNCYNLRTS